MGEYVTRDKAGVPFLFEIKGDAPSPTEMARITDYLANGPAAAVAPPPPPEEQPGIMENALNNALKGWNEMQAGGDLLIAAGAKKFGADDVVKEYEKAAAEQWKERDLYRTRDLDFTEEEGAYNKVANLAGQATRTGLAMVGQTASTVAGGMVGGPAGAVGGFLGGMALYAPQTMSGMVERQIEQHGYVKDYDKALWATAGSAAAETAVSTLTLGLGKVGYRGGQVALKALGVGGKGVAKNTGKDVVERSVKKAITIAAKKIGAPAAFAAVTGAAEEVLQQGMERWQAELPLMDEKSQDEYVESAIVGGILEGLFGVGAGIVGAHQDARDERAQRDVEADIADEAARRGSAAQTFAPQYEAKRKTPYIEPPKDTEENPVIAGLLTDQSASTREQTMLNKEENQLPPGMRDEEVDKPTPDTPAEQVGADEVVETPAPVDVGIPFVMTKAARAKLADLGYSPHAIHNMSPKVANSILMGQATAQTQRSAATGDPVDIAASRLKPGEYGPVKASFGSEEQYRNAIASLRDEKSISIDKIKKTMGVKQPQAEALFAEMLRRNDAFPAGSSNQYARITVPRGMMTREGSDVRGDIKGRRSRDYIVKPVRPANQKPFSIEIKGKKRGKGTTFSTRQEAMDWIAKLPANQQKNASVAEDPAGVQYGIHELHYQNMPNKEERLVGERVVNTYGTEAEAKEAIKGYDPAYSPESNKWRQEQAPEERQAAAEQDLVQELGPVAKIMKGMAEKVIGPGRVEVAVTPKITARNPDGTLDPEAIVEGHAQNIVEGNPEGVRKVLHNLITLANDLYNPNLSEDERAKVMEEVLNHELIHVLRNLDLLTAKEWNTLYQHALNRKVPGKTYTWAHRAAVRSGLKDPGTVMEEAVAEMFRYYMKDPTAFRNPERGLLRKLADFIKKMIRLGQRHSAADLMDTIAGGGIADRKIGHGGLGPRNKDDVFYSLLKSDNFYLRAERFIEAVRQEKASPEQWLGMIKNASITKEELNWLGVEDWLKEQSGSIDKRDILNFIKANGVTTNVQPYARETHPVLGKGMNYDTQPQHERLQSGKGAHYGEATINFMPKPGDPTFYSSHYDDDNVLAHVRFKDITDEDGKRFLFLEEIQSDLHQKAGKLGGYYSGTMAQSYAEATKEYEAARDHKHQLFDERRRVQTLNRDARDDLRLLDKQIWDREVNQMLPPLGAKSDEELRAQRDQLESDILKYQDRYERLDDAVDQADNIAAEKYKVMTKIQERMGIPNAPFKTNWEDYVIKRMMRHAVEHGYDGIAWHGQPESVAKAEGWGEIEAEIDMARQPVETESWRPIPNQMTYTVAGGQANVSPVVNRYLEKLPRIVRKLGQKFGADLETREASGPDTTGTAYEPPPVDTPEEIVAALPTKKSLGNLIKDMTRKYNAESGNFDHTQARDDEQLKLIDRFRKAHQVALNQRSFDTFDAVNAVGLSGKDIQEALIWTQPTGTWNDVVQSRRLTPEAGKGPFPWKHHRLVFTAAMQEAFERGDIPMFSMLRERKQEIMDNPKFQDWFTGSLVTDDNDEPKVMYHGTKADENFGRFRKLSHFGTYQAAEQRLDPAEFPLAVNGQFLMTRMGIPVREHDKYWANLPQEERDNLFEAHWRRRTDAMEKARIYPVFLNIRRPLEIQDRPTEHRATDYINAANRAGALSTPETMTLHSIASFSEKRGLNRLITTLEKKGYDGFVYRNVVEDPGSISWVTFREGQIKSIFNQGTWDKEHPDVLYSKLEQRGADLLQENDRFKHWFGGSRVADESGNPYLMFHFSNAEEDFDTFKPMSHFGTPEAAEVRWTKRERFTNQIGRTIPVFLSIKNPLKITDDKSNHNAFSYGMAMMDTGILPENEFRRIMALRLDERNNYTIDGEQEAVRQLVKILEKNGYDGFEYTNLGEDIGSTSYVTLHPNQVKSALSQQFAAEDDSYKYSMISPLYSATAPLGQRVPNNPPIDQLAEIHNKMTYDNLSPVIHRMIGRLVPGAQRRAYLKEKTDDTIISLQDRMLSVGRLIDRIKKNGGFISNENDTYLRETLYSSQTDAHLTANERDIYKPFEKTIAGLGVTRNDFEEAQRLSRSAGEILRGHGGNFKHALSELYLYAQHAIERNLQMRKRNAVFQKDARGNLILDPNGDPMPVRFNAYHSGSGMHDGEAQHILDWFASKPFAAQFNSETDPNSVRSRMRAIIRDTNKVRVAAGLTPDFSTMTFPDGTPVEVYKDYVPIRGFLAEASMRDDITDDLAKTGKGFNIRGKEDMSALGRENSLGRDIVAHAMLQNQEAVIRAGKNKVTQSFRQLILDNPSEFTGIANIVQMPRTKYAFDKGRGLVREIQDRTLENKPNILKGKVDGQTFYIELHDPRLVRAFGSKSGLGSNTGLNTMLKGLATLNRWLAATRTSWNPEFMVANMLRDLQSALINISEYEQKGIRREIATSVFPALRGVRRALRTGDRTSEWAKVYEEFQRHGGHTAVFGIKELGDTIERINKEFAEDFSGAMGKVKRPIKGLFKFIEDYNLAIENGTRLAAYKALRDKYLAMSVNPNDPQAQKRAREMAAFAAKNLTVNFNMGGEAKSVMSAFYMFFNASMQGSMALLNPFIRSRKMKKVWAGVLVAGAVQDMMMSMLSPEDDDGEKTYDKIPEYVLEHNMVFMDPFGLTERGYFKFPMPYLMNGIYNWGRAASRTARGKYTAGELLTTGGMTMVDSLNPWGGSNSWLNWVAPTLVDPFVDLSMNEDFTGKPIAPPRSPYDNVEENRSQQYWNNTNPVYVTIADWLSQLTGREGDYIPGTMEYSPNQVEYAVDWVTGGTGTFLARAGRLMYSGVKGELPDDMDVGDVPFARKGYGQITKKNDLQDYIEGRDQVLRIRKALQDARKEGDNELYMKIMRDYPDEYKAANHINAIENGRKKLSAKIKQIRESKRIPDERKEELIKTLKDRQDVLIGRGNQVLSEVD